MVAATRGTSQRTTFIYEPGQASFTRGLSTLVSNLHANRWFSAAPKIGVVQYEGAVYDHAVDDGLVTSLARLGLKITDRVKFNGLDNNSIAAGSANAVIKFHGQGINRVGSGARTRRTCWALRPPRTSSPTRPASATSQVST